MFSSAVGAESDELCRYLINFLKSVEVDQVASIELHTSWGKNFKYELKDVVGAKRCVHNDALTAKSAFGYILENTSTEFAGLNFKRFLKCLPPETQIDDSTQFSYVAVSLYFGSE